MKRRTLLAGSAVVPFASSRAAEKTKIVWWHAMTAALADRISRIADEFNKSQSDVELTAIYKGGYAYTMNAATAAFRAGQAPHLVQVFDVGTGTMINAPGKVVKQVWELSKETGIALEPRDYIGAVRGYYSLPDGRMASMPFNSSTAVLWYSKHAFKKAGLDPQKAPATWPEVVKAANAVPIPMTTSWPTWIQLEQYSALHNLPFATKSNGFEGLDAEPIFNSKAHVKHVQRQLDLAKDGLFKYSGRDNAPDPVLYAGDAGIRFGSSAMRGALVKTAKFEFGSGYLPYDPDLIATPMNSIIGGASLWTMTAPNRTPAEYKAVAQFMQFPPLRFRCWRRRRSSCWWSTRSMPRSRRSARSPL
jgi:sn-glycerol 3-phosphate transport system substrate-binding protein